MICLLTHHHGSHYEAHGGVAGSSAFCLGASVQYASRACGKRVEVPGRGDRMVIPQNSGWTLTDRGNPLGKVAAQRRFTSGPLA